MLLCRVEQVVEGEYAGLKGVQESMATFSLEGEKPNRQDVTFHGIQIHPTPDTDLRQWLEALKPENPQMVRSSIGVEKISNQLGYPNFALILEYYYRIHRRRMQDSNFWPPVSIVRDWS